MAGWLSSKLKVAEDFLHQIDQQAAESLGKQEKSRSHDPRTSASSFSETPHLQDQQFKKTKSQESLEFFSNNRSVINVEADKPPQGKHLQGVKKSSPTIAFNLQQEVALVTSPSIRTRVTKPLPDDWTELLASPELSTRGNNGGTSRKDTYSNSNGTSGTGIFPSVASKYFPSNSKLAIDSKKTARHDGKSRQYSGFDYKSKADQPQDVVSLKYSNEQGTIPNSISSIQGNGYDSSSSEVSANGWNGRDKVHRKSYERFEANENAKESSEGSFILGSSISASDVKEHSPTRAQPLEDLKEASLESASDSYDKNSDVSLYSQNGHFQQKDAELVGISENGIQQGENDSSVSLEETKTDVANLARDSEHGQYRHSTEIDGFTADASELHVDDMRRHYKQAQETPAIKLDGVHNSSSESDNRSETETDSASGSDSEDDEVERRKQSQIKRRAAQEAAEAAAVEAAKAAIKERKEFVMRLEREKEKLEKVLAEREEQQAREAAELQMNMKETMQAVDLEKENHNVTRMEALGRVAKLETENADLAKSLAAVQRNLELELNHVADLRREIESKEVSQAELERRLTLLHHKLSGSDQVEILKEVELEQERFDEKNLCQKIEQVQVKVKQLEENIERTTEAWEGPTEVEVELERRLSQLTDHLIQKQAQVEALSAEKATLLFRLEALSNTLYEERYMAQSHTSKGNKSSILLDSVLLDEDLEFGLARPYDSRRRGISEREDLERNPIFFLLRQLDMIFSAGAYYLRRHRMAKCFAIGYLLALHIWVIFVLFLRTQDSEDTKSGALFSLESINNGTNSLNFTGS